MSSVMHNRNENNINISIFSLYYGSNLACSLDRTVSIPNSSLWSKSLLITALTNNSGTQFKIEAQGDFHISDPISTLKKDEPISKQRNLYVCSLQSQEP
jgi:hypothetical protein